MWKAPTQLYYLTAPRTVHFSKFVYFLSLERALCFTLTVIKVSAPTAAVRDHLGLDCGHLVHIFIEPYFIPCYVCFATLICDADPPYCYQTTVNSI